MKSPSYGLDEGRRVEVGLFLAASIFWWMLLAKVLGVLTFVVQCSVVAEGMERVGNGW
jgi:hypothetical protein